MQTEFKVGDNVKTVGKYSGIISRTIYRVIAVSAKGNKVTIDKPEFKTKKEEFTLKNKGTGWANVSNDYTGYLIKA